MCLTRSAYARAEFAEALAWLDQAFEVDPGNEELDFQVSYCFWRADVHVALGASTAGHFCYERSAAACREAEPPAGRARDASRAGTLVAVEWRLFPGHGSHCPVVAQFDAGWRPEGIVTDDLRVLLTCYEALAALGDERANRVSRNGEPKMQARAESLEPSHREAFLGNVATNRSIVAAWDCAPTVARRTTGSCCRADVCMFHFGPSAKGRERSRINTQNG